MAWRIDEQVIRGEIDSRIRGRVTGRLWLLERPEPIRLDLAGNPWRDVAGHLLRFTNPKPKAGDLAGLTDVQDGVVGDITASRKVKVPDSTDEEFAAFYASRQPFPWHWGNSLYLEWFSARNGRVVVESAAYRIEIDPEAAWTMTPAEEIEQRQANAGALTEFMGRLGQAIKGLQPDDAKSAQVVAGETIDDDAPQSAAEAEADKENARMELLLDRIAARCSREGVDESEDFERIMEEECERLRIERGEKAMIRTPEQEAEQAAWIEEMNAAAQESLAEMESESWKNDDRDHPLVEHCRDLGIRLHHEVKAAKWLPADAMQEHPLREILDGLQIAGAKLGGALARFDEEDEWPPPALFAGDILVRLKKARRYLDDALRGLDSADAENLATPAWRTEARREVDQILAGVKVLIGEVREVLKQPGDEDDSTS